MMVGFRVAISVRRSVELPFGRGLLGTDAPRNDFCARVTLALHRRTGDAAKHVDLADVRQRICDGTGDEQLSGVAERRIARKVGVKRRQPRVKARDFTLPRSRRRVAESCSSASVCSTQ